MSRQRAVAPPLSRAVGDSSHVVLQSKDLPSSHTTINTTLSLVLPWIKMIRQHSTKLERGLSTSAVVFVGVASVFSNSSRWVTMLEQLLPLLLHLIETV
ncbi:hypothetical protein ACH5RR_037083 [Cinchona calisaya]|uniref:Uncharacterized protein n=1 Tax=Cinchona calisaya TaxID=153742 RepID=A0ABD2Y544_9GENT